MGRRWRSGRGQRAAGKRVRDGTTAAHVISSPPPSPPLSAGKDKRQLTQQKENTKGKTETHRGSADETNPRGSWHKEKPVEVENKKQQRQPQQGPQRQTGKPVAVGNDPKERQTPHGPQRHNNDNKRSKDHAETCSGSDNETHRGPTQGKSPQQQHEHLAATPPVASTPSATKQERQFSNHDIDRLLRRAHDIARTTAPGRTVVVYPATTTVTGRNKLLEDASIADTIILPMWFRHHWLMAVLHKTSTHITPARKTRSSTQAEVYDSAPSPAVRRDVERWFLNTGVTSLPLRWATTPQQRRGSNDCGPFAVASALLAIWQTARPKNEATNDVVAYVRAVADGHQKLSTAAFAHACGHATPSEMECHTSSNDASAINQTSTIRIIRREANATDHLTGAGEAQRAPATRRLVSEKAPATEHQRLPGPARTTRRTEIAGEREQTKNDITEQQRSTGPARIIRRTEIVGGAGPAPEVSDTGPAGLRNPQNKSANRCYANAAMQLIATDAVFKNKKMPEWEHLHNRAQPKTDLQQLRPDRDYRRRVWNTLHQMQQAVLADLSTTALDTGQIVAALTARLGIPAGAQHCLGDALEDLLHTIGSKSTAFKTHAILRITAGQRLDVRTTEADEEHVLKLPVMEDLPLTTLLNREYVQLSRVDGKVAASEGWWGVADRVDKFKTTPKTLHVFLRRARPGGVRSQARITIPKNLDLRACMGTDCTGPRHYRLTAVALHRGSSAQAGHYVAKVVRYTPAGTPYLFDVDDDEVVRGAMTSLTDEATERCVVAITYEGLEQPQAPSNYRRNREEVAARDATPTGNKRPMQDDVPVDPFLPPGHVASMEKHAMDIGHLDRPNRPRSTASQESTRRRWQTHEEAEAITPVVVVQKQQWQHDPYGLKSMTPSALSRTAPTKQVSSQKNGQGITAPPATSAKTQAQLPAPHGDTPPTAQSAEPVAVAMALAPALSRTALLGHLQHHVDKRVHVLWSIGATAERTWWQGKLAARSVPGLPRFHILFDKERCEKCGEWRAIAPALDLDVPFSTTTKYFSVEPSSGDTAMLCRCKDGQDQATAKAQKPERKPMEHPPATALAMPQPRTVERAPAIPAKVKPARTEPSMQAKEQQPQRTEAPKQARQPPRNQQTKNSAQDPKEVLRLAINCQGNLGSGRPNCPKPKMFYIFGHRPEHISALAWESLNWETRRDHIRWLRELRSLPADLEQLPLQSAVIELVRRMAVAKAWSITTVRKTLTTIRGALLALPMYTREAEGWDIADNPEWRAAQAAVGKLTNATPSNPPPAMSYAEYQAVCKGISDPLVLLFVQLMWALAGRPGDVAGLKAENIMLGTQAKRKGGEDTEDTVVPITVTIRVGKGARFRGPYPVSSTITKSTAETITKLLNQMEPGQRIFPDAQAMKKAAKAAIEHADSRLKLPSVRKGAARHLAAGGMSLAELATVLGHTRTSTTVIYLGYGAHTTSDQRKTQQKTKALHQPLNEQNRELGKEKR